MIKLVPHAYTFDPEDVSKVPIYSKPFLFVSALLHDKEASSSLILKEL